ncbi:hypothetical protein E4U32_002516 [Claviceps aff. humidiphila group G2b]|nr:hypothetical protein E4U32_002516 [Claviceps aff. humidiphila group G2b]
MALSRSHNPSSIAGTEEGAAWNQHSFLAQSGHGKQRQLVHEMQDRAVEARNRDDEEKEKQDRQADDLREAITAEAKTGQQGNRTSGDGRAVLAAEERAQMRFAEMCCVVVVVRAVGTISILAGKNSFRQRSSEGNEGQVVASGGSSRGWSLAGLLTSNF